jgi:hypothetical protein
MRDFRSENLYFDPAPLLDEKTLDVWFDPRNPKRYWVDTEFIKERRRSGFTSRQETGREA